MPIPTFPNIPDAPNRSTDTQAEFDTKAEAFTAYLADDFSTDMNTYATDLVDAAASANYTGTSVTSVAVGTGSKSFTTQTGKMFAPGQYLVIADTAAPTTNFMWGQVTSYNTSTGALVFESLAISGSGTKTAWNIGLSGPAGATGGSQLTSPTLVGTPVQDVYTMTDSVSVNIDPANGAIHMLTLTANRTLTHSLATGQFALLMVDDGTAYSITWFTITWKTNSGAAPTLLTSGRTPILIANISGTTYGWRLGDA